MVSSSSEESDEGVLLQQVARAQEILEYEKIKARKARRAEKRTRKQVLAEKLLEIQRDTHLARIDYAIGSDSDSIWIPKKTPNLIPPSPQAVPVLTTLLKSPNAFPASAKPTSSIVSPSPPASAATCLSSASAASAMPTYATVSASPLSAATCHSSASTASATPTSATVYASPASDSRCKSNLSHHYKGDTHYFPNIPFDPKYELVCGPIVDDLVNTVNKRKDTIERNLVAVFGRIDQVIEDNGQIKFCIPHVTITFTNIVDVHQWCMGQT